MSRIFGATTCTLLRPIILNSYKGILRSLASGESSLDKSKDVYYLETLSMNRVVVCSLYQYLHFSIIYTSQTINFLNLCPDCTPRPKNKDMALFIRMLHSFQC